MNYSDESANVLYEKIGESLASQPEGVENAIKAYEANIEVGAVFPETVATLYNKVKTEFESCTNAELGEFAFKMQAYSPRALIVGELSKQNNSEISENENTAENSGVKYSIKKTKNIPYKEQLEQIEKGQMNGSNSLYVGTPNEQLQSIGFSNNSFAMNQGDYKKSRRVSAKNKNYSSHAVSYEFFENMPHYIDTAPMFIDNGKKITIVTEYGMTDTKGNDSYVIVGVLRDTTMESDTVNLIKSVYPLDDFSNQIILAAEEGKLIITNKNKVEQMLTTIGVQPAEVSRIIDLAKDTISQDDTIVNTEDTSNADSGAGQVFVEPSVERVESDMALDVFARIENKKRYTPEQQELIDVLNDLGWTLDFDNVFVKDKNGKVVTKGVKAIRANGEVNRKQKTMVIDYKTEKPKIFVIGHEFVHFLEVNPVVLQEYINNVMDTQVFKNWMNEKGYNNITDFVNAVIDERLKKNDPNFIEVKDSKEDLERLAYCEIAADFTGEKVLDSYEKLQELVNSMEAPKRRSFLKIMKDFFSGIAEKIAIRRGGEKGFKAELNKLNRAFQKAYIEAEKTHQKENTADDSGVKYSFEGYAEDGKGMYRSNFPKGTPQKAKSDRILSYIKNVWSKKPIELRIKKDNEVKIIKAKFDPTYDESGNVKSDATKLMGGNRHGTAKDQRVTLDLADDYYQIASESIYNYSKSETGKTTETHKGVKEWHYFINDIYFAEYEDKEYFPYRVTINIKEKQDGEFVYSFSAEKQEGLTTPQTLHAVVNTAEKDSANGNPSIDNIQQNDDIVNNNISDSDTKYSISTDTNSDLLNQYDSGEISREEFLERLSEGKGKKTFNPKDIADLDPEVASTTPPLKRKKGTAPGDEMSNTYNSVLESSIFVLYLKEGFCQLPALFVYRKHVCKFG